MTKQKQSKSRKLLQKFKKSRNLLGIYKILLIVYQEFQLYNKTSSQTQRKEGMEVGKRIADSIWRTKKQDYELTSTHSFKER